MNNLNSYLLDNAFNKMRITEVIPQISIQGSHRRSRAMFLRSVCLQSYSKKTGVTMPVVIRIFRSNTNFGFLWTVCIWVDDRKNDIETAASGKAGYLDAALQDACNKIFPNWKNVKPGAYLDLDPETICVAYAKYAKLNACNITRHHA